jgi:phage-related protein
MVTAAIEPYTIRLVYVAPIEPKYFTLKKLANKLMDTPKMEMPIIRLFFLRLSKKTMNTL